MTHKAVDVFGRMSFIKIADATTCADMVAAAPTQLTQPRVKPRDGFKNSVPNACRWPDTGIAAHISPRHVVISQTMMPPMMYMTIAPPGPAVAMTSPELKNSPVPMVPPTPVMTAAFVDMLRFKPLLEFLTRSTEGVLRVLITTSFFPPDNLCPVPRNNLFACPQVAE